ncbi:HAD family hydrolase [Paenibacillus marinisediminis]
MRYSTICFDLDGTLTDPKIGITKSVQHALRKFDIHVEDLDQLEPFIGPPLMESFKIYYNFNEAESTRAIEAYREYFRERGMLENEIYPGIRELLVLLKQQKRKLFVATSKPTVFAEPILKHFQIDQYFDEIVGSELDGTRSDKAHVIKHILDTYPCDLSSVLMIGDRKHDIIGARKNEIDSIAVGFGYGSEEELESSRPTYYAATVQDLAQLFTRI